MSMYRNTEITAEVKTRSPFGWESADSWDELFEIAEKIGDVISVHTDPRWGGSFALLERARARTDKPLLAKGVHENDGLVKQALDAGADYVLAVGRIPKIHTKHCMIEPRTLEELKTIPATLKVVWNARDITDGGRKKETFEEARALHPGWLCQASYVETAADIKEGADAVLVGTHIKTFAASLHK